MSSSSAARLSDFLHLRFARTSVEFADQHALDTQRIHYESCADESLLVHAQAGDREALGVLFDRYARYILSVGLRIIRDSAEAEDLVHDIFLFILEGKNLFDPARGSARSWLEQMTQYRALDRRKYLKRRSFYNKTDNEPLPEKETSCGSDHPEFLYWKSYLKHAFDDLSENQRATLRLRFWEGLTINEIGARLGQSPGNISNHLYRGRARLRRLMTQPEHVKRRKLA